MKKKAITLLLSLVLASGSMGNVQLLAAETTEQKAEAVQETETTAQEAEPVQEEVKDDAAAAEDTAADVSEQETEEETVQENVEQFLENEDPEAEEPVDEEELDTSEEAAAEGLETEDEITDESEDALAGTVDSGSCGKNATWTLTGTGSNLTLTISGSGNMKDYDDSTALWAAKSAKIKKVVVEDGITSIGAFAFYSLNKLTDVSLPETVSCIGASAFDECIALKSIKIPEGVTEIEEFTFSGCRSLENITIPDSVTSIGTCAFQHCNNLTSITIPDGVTYIADCAFIGCSSLTSITIPDSVEDIEDEAFCDCSSLTSIIIPDGVTRIGCSVFCGCSSLTSITIPDSVTIIDWRAFGDCSSLTSITIPDSVTYMDERAFEYCSSLKSITIPNGMTSIADYSFLGCSSLKNITIPDGITSIGRSAFEDCSSLQQIILPESINDIEIEAFCNCNKLTAVVSNKYCLTYCEEDEIPCIYRTSIDFRLTSYNGSDIRVNITKKDDPSGYQIKYADNSSMTGAKSVMLDGSDNLSKVITGLKNGQTYYVKVQSYQEINCTTYWSNWSAAQSIKITQAPDKTNISKLSTYIGSHIKVDWPKAAGASGYHIKYADNSSMANAKEVFVKGNSTVTKTLTGLKNGKTYYVKIQTYRTVSGKTYWSSWSDAKSIKVDQKPYGSSVNKLTNPSSKAMKISWDKAPSATGYHIQYAADSSMKGTKDIYINNKDTLTKTVSGLTKGKTYYVRIQTFRKVSGKTYWSSWSKAKKIKITK